MRVVSQQTFGGPEVLRVVEAPRPGPGEGEVLVQVEASGLNPVETVVRSGALPLLGDPPFVLGWDVAGTVEDAGPGVTRFAPGDRVFGMPRFPGRAGTHAEYVTAPAAELAPTPAALDSVHAAALPLAGLTAWQGLVTGAGLRAGQHVLVTAGGGGVGHLAVQLAVALGARVTATASAGKAAFVKGLGADDVVDYRDGDLAGRVHDVDVVLDLVGGRTSEETAALLRPGGTFVTALRHSDAALAAAVEAAGRRFVGVRVHPDAEGLAALAALVTEGRLRVHVARTVPLEGIAGVHPLLEASAGSGSGTGVTGKLVAVP